MTEDQTRGAQVVAAARGWLGTPYHHQASVKGAGADCLGLVRGVYREIMGQEAEPAPAYSRDWGESGRNETLIEAALRHLEPVRPADMRPGDVLVFRMRSGSVAKHTGVLSNANFFIHAMEGTVACEAPLCSWWRRRIAAVFRFPD